MLKFTDTLLLVSTLALLLAAESFARPSEIDEIVDLTHEIRAAAENSDAGETEIRQAVRKLREARDLLSSKRPPRETNGCFEYAYARYVKSYGEGAVSIKEATALCQNVEDVRVLGFFYDAYVNSYGEGATSLKESARHTGFRGKRELLAFLYEKFIFSYGRGAVSVKEAAGVAQGLNRRALTCLEQVYPKMVSSYGEGATSVKESVRSCASAQ